jgi:nucleoside-diphosphate-sugar epimerase
MTVLLTGPTGVVGAPLLERLGSEDVVCLTHSTAVERPAVRGDITKPKLGLSDRDYRALTDQVDVVIHSAAATRFDLAREEIFAVNVDGMRHMLEFVADAEARLVALSTAFVKVEGGAQAGWVSPKHYLDSKRAAEALVRDSGLDWHIVRPSVVIGDSQTGTAARMQGFHFFFRALVRGDLPMIPVAKGDVIDFVAADVLADVLAAMVAGAPPWPVSMVTAGERAWPAERLIHEAVALAIESGNQIDRPRLMAPEAIDRLIRPVFFPELPKRIVRRYDQVSSLGTVVVTPERFDSSMDDLARHYGRSFDLALERTFERTIGALIDALPGAVPA